MEATVLAREFQRQFRTRYNQYPYSMKNVQEGKWWKFFADFCKKSELKDGKEPDFIEKLFSLWEEDAKIYPYALSQEIAKLAEESILERVDAQEVTEADYIAMTFRKAALWAKQNRVYNNKIGKFLTDPTCILRATRGEYYKPLFMFCSDFLRQYGELTENDVLKKNSIRAFHPDIYEALKTALNEKFVD